MRLRENLELLHSKHTEDNRKYFPPIMEEKEIPKSSRNESPATTYRYDASTARRRTEHKFTPEKIENVKLFEMPLKECRYKL
jgi:hypothetical protein